MSEKGCDSESADTFVISGKRPSIRIYTLWSIFGVFCVAFATCSAFLLWIIITGTWFRGSSGSWDCVKMGRLQPVLLEQVQALMVTANRSIHDPVARHTLRNLSKSDSKTCYTPNCLHTGLTLLEAMNFSVDPCNDFYNFVCQRWTEHGPLSPSAAASTMINSDQFTKINEKVIRATKRILETPEENSSQQSSIKMFSEAQKFYSQCKDIEQLERDGLKSLWYLIDSYGGWPILGETFQKNSTFDWLRIVADLQRLSCASILSIEIKQHVTYPFQNAIYIVPPKFFVAKEYLLNPKKNQRVIIAYRRFIEGLAKEFIRYGGGYYNKTRIRMQADDMIKFESRLAKLSPDDLETGKGARRRAIFVLHKLQRETEFMIPKSPRYPTKINWKGLLNKVFESSGIQFMEEERVIVQDISYTRGLSPLLSFTNPQTLQNYLMWRLLVTFTTGSTKSLRRLNFNFYHVVYGMRKIPPRASTCAIVVKDAFALAIGMKVVKGLTSVTAKKEVETIVENVKQSMEHLLDSQNLGPTLLLIGITRKLNTLKHCIGFPSSFQNLTAINEFYSTLHFDIKDENYLQKYIRIRMWLYDKTLITLREPFDTDCWSGTSWSNIGEAYAYYDTARNSINFPAGLLQAPFYRRDVPTSVNYGAIGAIIGHEISHSINFEGWIKVGLMEQLEHYWDCLLSHYSNYSVPRLGPDTRVNGLRTRSENLADHLGLAASYWAYKELQKARTSPQAIPGLDLFSPDQIFFISFGHMWCVNGPDEWLADELESSSHTPGKYRVLGSLQNSHDFAKAWACPLGSKMNPEKKCGKLFGSS